MTEDLEGSRPFPPDMDQRKLFRGLLDELWNQLSARSGANFMTAALQVPLKEGPALLGMDPLGMPHLLLPVTSDHNREVLLRTQGVRLEIRSLVLGDRAQDFLDLSCRRAELVRVFLSLTADACAELLADATDPVGVVRRLVEEWRELFGSGAGKWSRAQCASTFAELLVLRRLLKEHSGSSSAWVGPDGAAQDFRSNGNAIEVKSTLSPERRIVTVSGWDQLEPPADGALHLAWFRLEESDEGMSLREAVSEVIELSTDPGHLIRVVSEMALPDAPDPEVDGCRFALREELLYKVDEGFPAITRASFHAGSVPAGVVAMTYSVDLDMASATEAYGLKSVLEDLAASL